MTVFPVKLWNILNKYILLNIFGNLSVKKKSDLFIIYNESR